MNIYEVKLKCYNCGEEFSHYTYLVFHEYEIDVEFPLDMSFVQRVYSEMPCHKEEPFFDNDSYELNFPIKILGDDKEYDLAVINSGFFDNVKMVNSKTAHKKYAANVCPCCNSFTGNYHLREIITDNHLRNNISMKKVKEISL